LVGFDVMVEEAFSTNPRPGKQERCQQSRAQKGSSGGDGLAEGRPPANGDSTGKSREGRDLSLIHRLCFPLKNISSCLPSQRLRAQGPEEKERAKLSFSPS
jgi:hypothetical protein